MDLIYLRHGQTDWNEQGKLQGRTDIPLNKNGIFGAKNAGKVLSEYHFDAVYCSPLIRAIQTLRHACPKAVPILDERLSEWSFGTLEGQPVPSDFYSHRWFFGQPPIPGMEQIEDVVSRVCEFYAEIKQKHPRGTVLVVSHGGVSAGMYCAVYGTPKNENLSRYCLPNSVPVLFREGHPPVILDPLLA